MILKLFVTSEFFHIQHVSVPLLLQSRQALLPNHTEVAFWKEVSAPKLLSEIRFLLGYVNCLAEHWALCVVDKSFDRCTRGQIHSCSSIETATKCLMGLSPNFQ